MKAHRTCSFTLSLTSELYLGGWLKPLSRMFIPGKRPGLHCAVGRATPQSLSGWARKVLPPPEFDPRTVLSGRYPGPHTWLSHCVICLVAEVFFSPRLTMLMNTFSCVDNSRVFDRWVGSQGMQQILVMSDVWLTVHCNSVWIRKTN